MKALVLAAIAGSLAFAVAQSVPVLENSRVRVFRTSGGAATGIEPGPGVVVSLGGDGGPPAGSAAWLDDVSTSPQAARGPSIIVRVLAQAAPAPVPPAGSKPGDAPFTGMSFAPLFDNDRVAVIRARMEVGAREGFHTHASDTLVVHLSGGEIEDSANGTTVVNSWKPGDVEFEARGSSHSARNVGAAVDVVLVALKP